MVTDELAALELRSMRAAWRTLMRDWDVTPTERRALLPEGGEEDAAPPRDTETRMRLLVEVGYRVRLEGWTLYDWLRTPTPVLRWLTPLDAMSGTLAQLRGVRSLVDRGFAS